MAPTEISGLIIQVDWGLGMHSIQSYHEIQTYNQDWEPEGLSKLLKGLWFQKIAIWVWI